jgi:hypothetical protein
MRSLHDRYHCDLHHIVQAKGRNLSHSSPIPRQLPAFRNASLSASYRAHVQHARFSAYIIPMRANMVGPLKESIKTTAVIRLAARGNLWEVYRYQKPLSFALLSRSPSPVQVLDEYPLCQVSLNVAVRIQWLSSRCTSQKPLLYS